MINKAINLNNETNRTDVEQLLKKFNSGWERLFPDNPELENVFMN